MLYVGVDAETAKGMKTDSFVGIGLELADVLGLETGLELELETETEVEVETGLEVEVEVEVEIEFGFDYDFDSAMKWMGS